MSDSAHNEKVTVPCQDGWCGQIEIDRRWFQEWVDFGILQAGVYLNNQARFDEWCQETGR